MRGGPQMRTTESRTAQLHTEKKTGRQANMELLRMLSMMLVVVLHFLDKGGNLPALTESTMPAYGYAAWILESLAIVSVNVYMLLSGYFLIESSFKPKRLLGLLLQVWFYSIGIGLVAAAFGYLPEGSFGIHYLLTLFLPISMNHYWFMSAYVFMYLFVPLLSAGIKQLSKKQHQLVLGALLFAFCIIKSVVPARLEADAQGYDCIWYLCMFVTAAYIRRYGLSFFKGKGRSLFVYLAFAAAIFGVTFVLRALYLKTGSLGTILTGCYNYNHILVLAASLGVFYLFYHMQIKSERTGRLICRVAPYTLGVYLLHEHAAIRYEWQQWIYAITGKPDNVGSLLLVTAFAVLAVFLCGVLLDMVRTALFAAFNRLLSHFGFYKHLILCLDRCTIKNNEETVQ